MGANEKEMSRWINLDDFELKQHEKQDIADFFQTYFTEASATDEGINIGQVTKYLVQYLFTSKFSRLYAYMMSYDIETELLHSNRPTSPTVIMQIHLRKPLLDYLYTLLPLRGFTFMVVPKMTLANTTRSLARKATIDEILEDLA